MCLGLAVFAAGEPLTPDTGWKQGLNILERMLPEEPRTYQRMSNLECKREHRRVSLLVGSVCV